MHVLEEMFLWPQKFAQFERHGLLASKDVGMQIEQLSAQVERLC